MLSIFLSNWVESIMPQFKIFLYVLDNLRRQHAEAGDHNRLRLQWEQPVCIAPAITASDWFIWVLLSDLCLVLPVMLPLLLLKDLSWVSAASVQEFSEMSVKSCHLDVDWLSPQHRSLDQTVASPKISPNLHEHHAVQLVYSYMWCRLCLWDAIDQ